MSDKQLVDYPTREAAVNWRNAPVEKRCPCGTDFTGKYNSTRCDACRLATRKRVFDRFREDNPDYWRDWNRRTHRDRKPFLKQYGLSHDQYDEMIEDQGGKCAICGDSGGWRANGGRLVVDHNHATGAIRGLLCPSCNRGLGQFVDDPDRLLNAATYLREQNAQNNQQTKEN